jgi:hypothetical protein
MYVVGGRDASNNVEQTTYFARLHADGSVGTWNQTTALTAARFTGATVAYDDMLYYIGGHDSGGTAQTTVYYSEINPDGELSTTWTLSGSGLPTGNACINNSAIIANGYIYIAGGCGIDDDVLYSKINGDGTPGIWTEQEDILDAVFGSEENLAVFVANGYLYVVGGDFGDSVAAYPLGSNGALGTETVLTDIGTTTQGESGNAQYNGYFYLIGGSSTADGAGTARNTVRYASIPRVKVGASLDLVSFGGENLAEGRTGGTLTAGDTIISGTLNVLDSAEFTRSLNVHGITYIDEDLHVGDDIQFGDNNYVGIDNNNNFYIDEVEGGVIRSHENVAIAIDSNNNDADTTAFEIFKNGLGYDSSTTDGTLIFSVAETGTVTTAGAILPGTADAYDIGSTALEWDDIFIGDGDGLFLGADQDAVLEYDETTDDRVELSGTNAHLFLEDKLGLGKQSTTTAGSGVGTETVTVTDSYIALTVTDNGDTIQLSESGAKDGDILFMANVDTTATDTVNIDEIAGQVELSADPVALDQGDTITLMYMSDLSAWVQIATSNN